MRKLSTTIAVMALTLVMAAACTTATTADGTALAANRNGGSTFSALAGGY